MKPTETRTSPADGPELSTLIDTATLQRRHQGARHTIYRAEGPHGPVVIKQTAADPPPADAVASLRHEHALLDGLDLPGVAKVLGIARRGTGLALLMADAGTLDLAQRIAAGLLPIAECLDIAVQLAEAVARLHQVRIVHRNLNPGNVVWDAGARRATLVDFGIATTLSALAVEGANPAHLEGTLPYMSPEQTGRTGRSVDSRTDLYSLGATLYEMLAGAPPFAADDPVELVHAHLARRPRPPHELNAGVPPTLSAIVLKLLEKAPEQRYQTAAGLAADLREALHQWLSSGTVAPFPLAYHDVPRELRIPDKVYGRDEALQALNEAFARACAGQRELVLITGDPGIGKSALVGCLERPVAERRGRFITGKFDQLQRSVPYAGLVQAFRVLVRQLLAEPEHALAAWRKRIQAAVAPNGQVLVEVIPEIERLLGPQAPVTPLDPVEAKNRFNLVFTAFLRVFAQPEHPLALFLDDLQWVDAASLGLIEQWIDDADSRQLLLLGAYRDNEVGPSHPLALSLAERRKAGVALPELHLGPITRADVAQLMAETLNQDEASLRPLADLVTDKTAGNPFFVRRLLQALHGEGLIRFDPQSRAWTWDMAELARAPVSDNVLDLMVRAIDRLPEATRTLLQAGACIGHRFSLGTLAEVTGRTRAAAMDALWPALEDGLLQPLREAYKAPRQAGPLDQHLAELPAMVQFVHDRVQQAAYSLLGKDRCRALHLDIGRRLLQGTSPEQLEERLFDVVDQLDLGEALLDDPLERLRLAELNLAAGRKAKASAAYQAAFDYLSVGLRQLPDNPCQVQPALCFALHREMAECAYLTARHAMADELVETALDHAPSRSARTDLYTLRALAAMVAGDSARALRIGRDGLALFGFEWPLAGIEAAIEAEAAAVTQNLGGRRIEELAHAPDVEDEDTRACMRLLSMLGPPAYFSGANDVLAYVMMKGTNLALRHGPSPYSSYAYVFYGALLNGRSGGYDTGYAFGRVAVELARRFGNRAELSRTLQVFSLIVSP